MNPIARLNPKATLYFLLFGEVVYYLDGKKPERVWDLNLYASAKTRRIAERKFKRQASDIIFIEWDVTMAHILKEGKYASVLPPDKVLLSDKLDIFKQIKA